MEDENIYFLQFKNYFLSNVQLLNILNSDNIKDYDNDWSSDIFYAISSESIQKWKSLIQFDRICQLININKKNTIGDMEEKQIIEYIQNIPNLEESMYKFKFKSLCESFLNSVNSSEEDAKKIFNFSEFDLISKNAWDSFVLKQKDKNDGKILIRKGKKKIVIKFDDNKYNIIYLHTSRQNTDYKDIPPYELNFYLNELVFEISEHKDTFVSNFINEIIKININDWLDKINYKEEFTRKEYIYNKFKIIISDKNRNKFRINDQLISVIENAESSNYGLSINKSMDKTLINQLKYINTIIVKRVKNTSYIIASMFSLSQIPEFADYFYFENIKFNGFSPILIEFQKYINELWKKNLKDEKYDPSDFMRILKYKDKNTFNFKKEGEPIHFLNKIFTYIKEELNKKDLEIHNYLDNSKDDYKNIPDFLKYYNFFLKDHDSIIGKIFYGFFAIKNTCPICGEKIEYEKFKYINIDTSIFTNSDKNELNTSKGLDDSFVYFYFEDLIDYYFNKENTIKECKNCLKDVTIEKKIIKFPDIIIFRIKWDDFDADYGFKSENIWLEENKLIFEEIIDLTNYSFMINKDKIKYKLRSVINYGIINESNKEKLDWKKFVTFSRNLVDNNIYLYQPNGNTVSMNRFNRKKFVPSVLFYEKMK